MMLSNTVISKQAAMSLPPPPPKRHITTHDESGRSVLHPAAPDLQFGALGAARSYAVSSVPALLAGDQDVHAYLSPPGASQPQQQRAAATTSYAATELVIPHGANLVVVDLPPGTRTPMHRTVSLDFSICVAGVIEMELDGGENIVLRPGVSRFFFFFFFFFFLEKWGETNGARSHVS
jgi:hypothetical protein